MKCIRHTRGTRRYHVERVSDEDAHTLVSANNAVYISKTKWREKLKKEESK